MENALNLTPKLGRCWFCGAPLDDLKSSYEVRLRRVMGRSQTAIQYLERKVLIPRCGRCKTVLTRQNLCVLGLPLVPALIAGWLSRGRGFWLPFAVAWICGAILSEVVAQILSRRMGIVRHANGEFPRCLYWIDQGWQIL